MNGLSLTMYDKNFLYLCDIGDPISVVVTVRYNVESTATIVLAADHFRLPLIIGSSTRFVISGEFGVLMQGYVTSTEGIGPGPDSTVTIVVTDDFILFKDTLGWVQPYEPIDQQGIAGTYDHMFDVTAEDAVKYFAQRNMVDRLHRSVTVAPNLERGKQLGEINFRFQSLYDGLFPVVKGAGVDDAGIEVFFRQVGTGLVLDVREPSPIVRRLSVEAGVIDSYSWRRTAGTATRVVVGGSGEGVLRVLRSQTDTDLEGSLGRHIERFRDASGLAAEDADLLRAAGRETLDAGRPTSGLSVTLSESTTFRYGALFRVGDTVAITLPGGVVLGPDVLREVTVSWTREEGLVTTPRIGDRQDDPDALLAGAVQALARKINTQEANR